MDLTENRKCNRRNRSGSTSKTEKIGNITVGPGLEVRQKQGKCEI